MLKLKRKGQGGMVLISVTLLAGIMLSALFYFSMSTFSSSTVHSLVRAETHKLLATQKVPGGGVGSPHCEDLYKILTSNGIISNRADILGTCTWKVEELSGKKMVATITLPDMMVHGNQISFKPVKAYRE